MKCKAACCVILLVCLMLPAGPVTTAAGGTGVSGTVPLVTYEVSASGIGHFTAIISWETNGNATSQVFYDTRSHEDIADYAYHTGEDTTLVSEHSATLPRLRPRTTYRFRVRSASPVTEFAAISDEYSFPTLSPPVVVIPPVPPGPPPGIPPVPPGPPPGIPPVPPGPPPGIPPVPKTVDANGILIREIIVGFLNGAADFVASNLGSFFRFVCKPQR